MSGEWKKQNLRLNPRHAWKSKPGFAICVMDRGAIRFDYPEGWHVSAEAGSLNVRDRPEPDDNCILAVSQMRLPRGGDRVPVRELVSLAIQNDERQILDRRPIVEVPRGDGIELAYAEILYHEPKENRDAISRLLIARGAGVYCLLTFDFWVEETAERLPVWEEALRSLTLGMYIQDPTVGPIVH